MKNFNYQSISLKAVDAKARKAAANAAFISKEKPKRVAKAKTKKMPAIEREIRSIFRVLSSKVSDNQVVLIDRSPKGASRVATISIYNREDIEKSKKSFPILMYAFYSHTLDDNKLGSVAIYCSDASIHHSLILKRGSLFGHRITSVTLKMGRRPFVDVQLAA